MVSLDSGETLAAAPIRMDLSSLVFRAHFHGMIYWSQSEAGN